MNITYWLVAKWDRGTPDGAQNVGVILVQDGSAIARFGDWDSPAREDWIDHWSARLETPDQLDTRTDGDHYLAYGGHALYRDVSLDELYKALVGE